MASNDVLNIQSAVSLTLTAADVKTSAKFRDAIQSQVNEALKKVSADSKGETLVIDPSVKLDDKAKRALTAELNQLKVANTLRATGVGEAGANLGQGVGTPAQKKAQRAYKHLSNEQLAVLVKMEGLTNNLRLSQANLYDAYTANSGAIRKYVADGHKVENLTEAQTKGMREYAAAMDQVKVAAGNIKKAGGAAVEYYDPASESMKVADRVSFSEANKAEQEAASTLRIMQRELDSVTKAEKERAAAIAETAKAQKAADQSDKKKVENLRRQLGLLSTTTAQMKDMSFAGQKEYAGATGKSIRSLKADMDVLRRAGDSTSTAFQSLDVQLTALQRQEDKIKRLIAGTTKWANQTDRTAMAVKRLADYVRKMPRAAVLPASLITGYEKLEKLQSAYPGVGKKVVETNNKVAKSQKGLNRHLSQGSLLIKQFFRYALGYGALFRMLTAVQSLVKGVVDLEQALYSIQAITASSDAQMMNVAASIKQVATETKFTTNEVAKAAQVLAQAGVDPDQIDSVLSSVANFAAGTETSIQTAADLVSTMRNVFQELDDMTISDKLTRAVNISKLTGDNLKIILGISAQVAKQFNLSSDQYLAAVSTLRNAGLKASTVATGLRQGLLELFSPDTKTVKALKARYKQLGDDLSGSVIKEKFFGFTKEANPLLAVLRELNRLGFTKSGKETLARGFDVRAQNAITAMINSIDELEEAEAKLASSGAAAYASRTQMEGLRASLDNLGAAMTVLAADITEGPIAAFEDLVDSMTDTIKVMDELEVTSKSLTGESGLADVLSLAVSGGVLGSMGASTPKRRAILALGGATVGGALGTSLLESGVESGDTGVLDKAADVANSFVAIWAIGKVMGGVLAAAGMRSSKAVTGEASMVTGGFTAGIATLSMLFSSKGWLGKQSKAVQEAAAVAKANPLKVGGAAVLSLGTKLLGVAGFIYAAYEALGFLADLTIGGTAEDELRKRTNAARNRQKEVINKKQEYETAKAAFGQYRVSSSSYRAQEGSEAQAVESLKTVSDGYQEAVDELLKDTGEAAVRRVDQLFKDLRVAGDRQSDSYKRVFDKIRSELVPAASEYTDEQITKLLDSRLEFINQIRGRTSSLYSQYETLIDLEMENKLTELDAVVLGAIRERFAALPGLASAMQGNRTQITPDELVQQVYMIFKDISEDMGYAAELTSKEAAKGKANIKQATATIQTWSSTTGLNIEEIRRAVINYLSSITSLTGVSVELLDNIALELEEAKAQVQGENAERVSNYLSQRLAAAASLNPESFRSVKEDYEKANADTPAIVEALDRLLKEVEDRKTGLGDDVLESNEEIIKEAANVIRNMAGAMHFVKEVYDETTPGALPPKAVEIIETLLSNNYDVDELSEKLVTTPDEEGRRFKNILYDVLNSLAGKALGRETRDVYDKRAQQYIPETTSAERVHAYDEQIRKLDRAKNYGVLSQDSASNPVVLRAQEVVRELERALGIAKAKITTYVSEQFNGQADDLDETQEEVKKLRKLELAAAKAKIAVDKANRDKELKLINYSRKVQEQTLKADRLALDGKISANAAEIKGAVIAGNATGVLAGLQEERAKLAEMRRDLERRGLKLEGMSNEQIERIMAARETRDKAQKIIDSAMEELSAMRFRMYTEKVTGEFNTMNHALDSYRDAIDYIATDAEKIESFKRQIKSLYPELVRLKQLKQEAFAGATNPMLSPEERAAHKETFEMHTKQLDQYQKMMGKLVGQYERLAITANFARQMVIAFDVRSILADFENLQSDIKELGKTIRADFVGAIDEVGPAITNALIHSKSVTEAIRQVFFNMFSNMAEHLAANLVNNLMQEMLIKMQSAGIRNLFGNLFGAMDIPPIGSEAAMGDALKSALPGANPAVLANTTAIHANTAATTANTGAVGMPVIEGGGIPIGSPSPTPGNRMLRVTDDKDDLGAGLMQQGIETNQHLAGLVAGDNVTAGLFTDLITGLSAGVTSIVTAIFSSSAAESGSGAAVDLLGAVASSAKAGMAKIKSYGGGGRIAGPGTGTSDSILGAVISAAGKVTGGVRVSDGESILTAKATDFLGENFINAINSNRMAGLATGGVIGTMSRSVDWGDSAASFSAAAANHTTNVAPQAIRVINTVDKRDMANAMNSPPGEKVVLNIIRANKNAVKQVLV